MTFISSFGGAPTGVGEPGTPVVAPAVANACSRRPASLRRLRSKRRS